MLSWFVTGKEGDEMAAAPNAAFVYKWTDEDVEQLIKQRMKHNDLFSGRRNAALHGWEVVLKEMGPGGVLSPARVGKKWENLKKTYKELKMPPTGQGTESGEDTAASWKWYPLMDEALGGRPSIRPPVLVASAWGESSRAAAVSSPDTQRAPPSPADSSLEEAGPAQAAGTQPKKRQRADPVLEFLEAESARAEERARREEEREERLLSLLEKIADRM